MNKINFRILFLFLVLISINLNAQINVRIKDNTGLSNEIIKYLDTLEEAELLKYNKLKERIIKIYINNGYTLARVSRMIYRDNKLVMTIDEGRIRNVKIDGNKRVRDNVITKIIGLKKGDIFNKFEVEKQLKKIGKTGFFRKIKYKIFPKRKYFDIVFIIKEKNAFGFDFGGSIDKYIGAMANVSFFNRKIKYFNHSIYTGIGFFRKVNLHNYGFDFEIKKFTTGFNFYYTLKKWKADLYNTGEFKTKFAFNSNPGKKNQFIINCPVIFKKYYHNPYFEGNVFKISPVFSYLLTDEVEAISYFERKSYKFSIEPGYISNNYFYCKFYLDFYIHIPIGYYLGLILENHFKAIAGKYIFDEIFPIGKYQQRGYRERSFWSPIVFTKTFQFEQKLFSGKFAILEFVDLTFQRPDENKYFIGSFGTGFRIIIFGLEIQITYALPFDINNYGQVLVKSKKFFF